MIGRANHQGGFAYMALLMVIIASSILLFQAIPDKHHMAKREREAQLLFVGEQYQQAIKSFYLNPSVSIQRYPESLAELLEDRRTVKPSHHLRRLYRDPMSKDGKWGLVLNENKQIMGVHSLSQQTMLKVNIDSEAVILENHTGRALNYADLKFSFVPSNKATKSNDNNSTKEP